MRHVDPERLTLLALDEDVPPTGLPGDEPWERTHLLECPACRAELSALRHVVDVGRSVTAEDLEPPPPPPRVWDAIRTEIQTADTAIQTADILPLHRPDPAARRGDRRRRLLTAAAACVLGLALGAGATIGWQQLREPRAPAATVVASTALAPIGNAGGTGDARLVRIGERLTLEVDARNLPLTDGFYEAWMFVPGTTRMQAMGAIRPGEVTRFPIPAGLDPAGWRGIDVSAEAFDGDPAHSATSVLRGELRR